MDRAAQRRADADWLRARWSDERTRVVHVHDGRFDVLDGPDGVALALVPPYVTDEPPLLLGIDDADVAYFAVTGPRPGAPEAEVERWPSLRTIGAALSARDRDLALQALGLANWHATHTHCPRCGAATVSEESGYARRCVVDGSVHHPRTDPAVIVLVTDENDRALLGRSAKWQLPMFSTLAGFVEPGESAEQAVAREVGEESAVVVDDVEFVASQPWPFPASLMLGFRARARSRVPVADGDEMVEVRWFSRDELAAALTSGEVLVPPPFSIARRLITDWFGRALPTRPGARDH